MHIQMQLTIEELGREFGLNEHQQQAVLCWLAWHLWHIQNPQEGPGCCKHYDPLTIAPNANGYKARSYVLLKTGRGFGAQSLAEIEQRLMQETITPLAEMTRPAYLAEKLTEKLKQLGES